MFFKTNDRLACCDAATGKLLWLSSEPNQFELDALSRRFGVRGLFAGSPRGESAIRRFGDRLYQEISIAGDSIYSLEGDVLLGGVPKFLPPDPPGNSRRVPRKTGCKWLTAYEAMTGKLKWQQSLHRDRDGVRHHAGFLAAPVPFEELLLVPVAYRGGLWLYALDRGGGQTVWKKFLYDEPPGGSPPWSPCGISVAGNDVYVGGGTGFVFALDARSGRFHWAVAYPRTGKGSDPARIPANLLDGWDDETLVAHGKWLIVLASDSNRLFAVDRRDGRLLWEGSRSAGPIKFPRARYCLGVLGTGLFVAGEDDGKSFVHKHDVRSGKLLWEMKTDQSFGRGMLTDEAVYVPVGERIVRLDLETGKETGRLKIDSPPRPVGNLFSDGRRLLVAGPDRVYALAASSPAAAQRQTGSLSARLGDGSFHVREAATRSLLAAGSKAIPAVVEAATDENAEVRSRAFQVLFRLSQSDAAATRKAALQRLEALSKSRNREVARRAARILNWPEDHALAVLKSRGARFDHRKILLTKAAVTDDDLRYIRRLTHFKELWLDGTKITDAGLEHLKGLTHLEALGLTGTKVTDQGMVHLAGLTNLESLFLRDTQITDAGIAHLKGMTAMKQLRLQNTRITDAGMAHLSGLTNLRLLFVENTGITDAGLVHLKNMRRLRHLYMHDNNISDAGLVHLKVFPELFAVSLDNTKVTDAGLVNFIGLPRFERLYLSGTAITDAGLLHLQKIKTLSDINLKGTQITDAGVEHLQKLKQLARVGLPQQPKGKVTREAVNKLRKALPRANDVY